MAYWGIALDLLEQLARRGSAAGGRGGRLGRARKGACDRREDPARARLDRGVERLLPRPRQDPGQCPARRLQQGDGAADATLPRRLRGAGVLCADLAGVGVPGRHDLCQPAQVGGNFGKAIRPEPAASGRDAFPHSCLRLPPARRKGHPRCAALCGHRASGAARPAHAIAYLLHGRAVGGIDRVERFRARNPARLLSRGGFLGLRALAACAGRQGQGADRQITRHRRPRRSSHHLRQLHGQERHAGALCARTRRLGRRRGAPDSRRASTRRPIP